MQVRSTTWSPRSVADSGQDGAREDRVPCVAWPAERAEGHECDPSQPALLQHIERALIREIEQVLHADDLGLGDRSHQVPSRDIAQPDAVDQPFIAGGDGRGQLGIEPLPRRRPP
jgi:hypothetical protein